jgi:hypothetical protein
VTYIFHFATHDSCLRMITMNIINKKDPPPQKVIARINVKRES